jgi:hypothetical protein
LRVSKTFEEILSCFTYIILRVENGNYFEEIYALVLHFNLFESLLVAMVIYEFGPKVIDIQD